MNTHISNKRKIVKNPNWQEADQLDIYSLRRRLLLQKEQTKNVLVSLRDRLSIKQQQQQHCTEKF